MPANRRWDLIRGLKGYLWSGYQGKEEKEDAQEKRGWKVYEQP